MSEIKRLNRECPICHSEQGTVLRKIEMVPQNNMPIPSEYDVVSCCGCGFAYADVKASQKDYDEYYETCNIYSDNERVKSIVENPVHTLRFQLLEKYVKKSDRIVDVGCGSGSFLKYLKGKGFDNLYGIDPAKESIKKLKECGIDGEVRNIFEAIPKKSENIFDVVISTSVIEHIYDLSTFCRQLTGYLKNDGILLLDAPSVEGFEKYYTQLPNYFNHEHINYFSLISLDNLWAQCGYARSCSDRESIQLVNTQQPEMIITAIYRKSNEILKIKRDQISQMAIENYLSYEQKKHEYDMSRIREFVVGQETPVVIFGGGGVCYAAFEKPA